MEKIWDTFKVVLAWFLTLVAGISLDTIAIVLAITYSTLQISVFFYPWHKKLWKHFGVKE